MQFRCYRAATQAEWEIASVKFYPGLSMRDV